MSSVRVASPDWPAVFTALEAWAGKLVAEVPAVLGVLLYGSLARGDYAPGSDADLLVVLSDSSEPPANRPPLLPVLHLPICHEVLVYTEDELERRASLPFLRRALNEGRWLSHRPAWQLPPSARERIE